MKLDPPINKQNVPELVAGLSLTTAGSMRTDDTYNPIHYEGELVVWPTWNKKRRILLSITGLHDQDHILEML